MEIRINRIARKERYTIGNMYVDDTYFCDTLEDADRGLVDTMEIDEILENKLKGITAIPTGKYDVILTFSPRFKRVLPLLLNVKGFEGIRIHAGNTAEDTEGCLLVGENKEKGKVINSRVTFEKLMSVLLRCEKKKEKVTITIE
ncbi:DUF5675 family protein [Prevotella sp. oral taxon 299]|uniref:DUF5675 family protein n=1 Tax=Prevotella sp. oral taxon 299 TaxID=652716 RepID=UPI0001C3F826|nr:DUF5675 family protein [Prevotella sp. oral taxon 299]EFC71557.1 hypothetical protein HMPREF0669_00229 [Prevotella sp. oral taxon 299 str. F0039]